jgi:hypothetical protein
MSAFSASSSPEAGSEPPATAPVRSPRTSIILAELARQRRHERRQRRLKRQQRRRAWGYAVRRDFPIPPLVTGLPWRFTQDAKNPVVPEAEFVPLELPSLLEPTRDSGPR